MDYVVYGTGYGATLMLLGYAVRTWGPGWRFRDGEEAAYDRREFRSARSAWKRFAVGLGAVIATAGAALVLLTFILMLINPGDGIGSTVALSVTGLLLIGVAAWAWLFFSRFGAWGIVSMPDALASYEPARYDSRAVKVTQAQAEPDEDETEALAYDEDEFLEDEDAEPGDDEDAEFAARYSKFELHHPEGEESPEAVPAAEDDARFEAQYSKFESHHPEDEPSPEDDGEGEIAEIEEYVETLTPEEVSEDIVDTADEEPVSDEGAAAPIEAYEDLIGRDTTEDAIDDDPLEVVPDAHDDLEPVADTDTRPREEASGREDALRRLRERQAQRARQQRPDDDA